MCDTCGCNQPAEAVTFRRPGEEHHHHPNHEHHHDHDHAHGHGHTHDHTHPHIHPHARGHDHEHAHGHDHGPGTGILSVEQDVLLQNNLLAQRNRGWFEAKGITALNLVSSPGSGKTTLLEKTIRALDGKPVVSVIEGDQQTMNDADRIAATGAAVLQVNTGNGCHLDADMIRRACEELDPPAASLLMIENVGNLVCPALFDLGEAAKVVIISVTEGDDKPLKYPNMFAEAELCLINKIDLLPYVEFDVDRCIAGARAINPALEILRVSATTGEGLDRWLNWLQARTRG